MHPELPTEILFKKFFFFFSLICIFIIFIVGLFFLSSCNSLPQLYQYAEEVLTDEAISLQIDKEAFQKDTDLEILVRIINKDMAVHQ